MSLLLLVALRKGAGKYSIRCYSSKVHPKFREVTMDRGNCVLSAGESLASPVPFSSTAVVLCGALTLTSLGSTNGDKRVLGGGKHPFEQQKRRIRHTHFVRSKHSLASVLKRPGPESQF